MTAEEISEYLFKEHTPYSNMTLEEAKIHIKELIERYGNERVQAAKDELEGVYQVNYHFSPVSYSWDSTGRNYVQNSI